MNLAFSTNAYTRFPLVDALRGIKSAGFSGAEILADAPHAYPDSLDSSQVASIARELERLDLRVSNINANCSFGYWKDAPPEPYFEPSQLVESLKPILDRAHELGVNVGIECEPGLLVEYVQELDRLIENDSTGRLGANLDIGHSYVLGEDVPFAIELLDEKIWNMHIEDIPNRKHYHMIPGEGTMPWPAIRQALKNIRYDRFLTVELYTHTAEPQTAAEKSFGWLSQFLSW
jgi:sugar phosphate isomerase/epimerase